MITNQCRDAKGTALVAPITEEMCCHSFLTKRSEADVALHRRDVINGFSEVVTPFPLSAWLRAFLYSLIFWFALCRHLGFWQSAKELSENVKKMPYKKKIKKYARISLKKTPHFTIKTRSFLIGSCCVGKEKKNLSHNSR